MEEQQSFSECPSCIPEHEGQLSVDILEDDQALYIRSAVAGTRTEDLDIAITYDTITIRGKRQHSLPKNTHTIIHLQECYWGEYSRSVVLPSHIQPDKAEANIQNGILTITLPKAEITEHLSILEIE
ncbi:MAG: Small heat shock protein [Candidatus Uhrbacteria bacterium GW2011_GWF2_41_16]|jgi:HSP20 family protein|uniref:Small heat shock protein n=2 Tax=Candidatus Uhriibacteriota TaxID=1752732 RepID=A0A0G0YDC5_9BACT|nr:MAG: Small heat shock protein [Candidatus Uhrbacteria bacterium GW2011_GWC2_41_11]KKR98347.1 MAG: Small heat shock protein [Candidatus Uhrbacteria bacterium GW2011_GWF2_41_16]HBP00071.1 hypothetical protein [Candidatus Uhrbacteria bacterium]